MKILNFGSCNIDFVYRVPHIVKPGETLSSYSMSRFPGGKGLNQSVAVAKSGERIYHAGAVGEDGLFLRDVLIGAGVDVSLLKISKEPTGNAIIQVDGEGQNSIILLGGANTDIDEKYVDSVLENFGEGDITVLQNEISSLEYIIEQAYNKGMRIMLNPSPFDEKLKNIDLNMIDTLILNEVEGESFTGETEPERIINFFKEKYKNLNVLLTLGEKGCMYLFDGEIYSRAAFNVTAVDTTSAGDTFTGYFISGLVRDNSPEEIIKFASAASAIAVSRKGAAVSIPERAETEEFLSKLSI